MPLSPYITFSGNCAAAIAFYRQKLGAELVHQLTY
ncbi:VOC family protein, partial [Escherichia coli]|nr:VOC family protein [Escherichia coli]